MSRAEPTPSSASCAAAVAALGALLALGAALERLELAALALGPLALACALRPDGLAWRLPATGGLVVAALLVAGAAPGLAPLLAPLLAAVAAALLLEAQVRAGARVGAPVVLAAAALACATWHATGRGGSIPTVGAGVLAWTALLARAGGASAPGAPAIEAQAGWRPALGAGLALGAALLLELDPLPWRNHLTMVDVAWGDAMHAAALGGPTPGVDFHYPYGPLGFLAAPLPHPDTIAATFAWRVASAVAIGLSCFVAGGAGRAGPLVPFALTLAVVGGLELATRRLGLHAAALLVLFHAPRGERGALLLLPLLGVASWIKVTDLAAGLAVVGAVVVACAARRRPGEALAAVGLFAASLVGTWCWTTGAGPGSLAEALRQWLAIARGYGAVMSLPFPPLDLALTLGATGLALGGLVSARGRARGEAAAMLAGWGALAWLTLKHAFVRFDEAHADYVGALPVVVAMSALLAARARRRPRRVPLVALAVALVFAARHVGDGASPGVAADLAARASAPLDLGEALQEAYAVRDDLAAALQRALGPLVGDAGTIDVYTWQLALAQAFPGRHAPRPSLQSFGAVTPELARRDAERLAGDAAPTWLFVAPREAHSPCLDGPSWLELLRGYDPVVDVFEHVALRRRAAPRAVRHAPPDRRDVALGEWLEVPAEGVVWCALEAAPSRAGALAAAALQAPPLWLELAWADRRERHRVAPDLGPLGFLLAPYPGDAAAVAGLVSGPPRAPRPRALRFDADGRWAWSGRVTVSLWRVEFE